MSDQIAVAPYTSLLPLPFTPPLATASQVQPDACMISGNNLQLTCNNSRSKKDPTVTITVASAFQPNTLVTEISEVKHLLDCSCTCTRGIILTPCHNQFYQFKQCPRNKLRLSVKNFLSEKRRFKIRQHFIHLRREIQTSRSINKCCFFPKQEESCADISIQFLLCIYFFILQFILKIIVTNLGII